MLFNVFNAQMQDMGIALSIARIAGLEVEERKTTQAKPTQALPKGGMFR